jgi:hypothetical protein
MQYLMRYLVGLFMIGLGVGAAYFLIEPLSIEERAVLLGVVVGVAVAGPLALLIALALRRAARPAVTRMPGDDIVRTMPLVVNVTAPAPPPEPARLLPADMYQPVQVQTLTAGNARELSSEPNSPFRIVEW